MPARDPSDRRPPGVNSDESLDVLVDRLFDHVEATGQLPIDRQTSRWLGEAEAVARDVATNDLDEATIRRRVRQVNHLLEEAGRTDHKEANRHLDAARGICEIVLEDE